MKYERRSELPGRRETDNKNNFCSMHHEVMTNMDRIGGQLNDTVSRWIIIGIATIGMSIIGYLALKIDGHNSLIREISVRQSSILTNQKNITDNISDISMSLHEIIKNQSINANSIKTIESQIKGKYRKYMDDK